MPLHRLLSVRGMLEYTYQFPAPGSDVLKRIAELLHQYQVHPAHADHLLERAAEEVVWRRDRTRFYRDRRFVGAVERRARSYQRVLRHRCLEILDHDLRTGGGPPEEPEDMA